MPHSSRRWRRAQLERRVRDRCVQGRGCVSTGANTEGILTLGRYAHAQCVSRVKAAWVAQHQGACCTVQLSRDGGIPTRRVRLKCVPPVSGAWSLKATQPQVTSICSFYVLVPWAAWGPRGNAMVAKHTGALRTRPAPVGDPPANRYPWTLVDSVIPLTLTRSPRLASALGLARLVLGHTFSLAGCIKNRTVVCRCCRYNLASSSARALSYRQMWLTGGGCQR